MMDRNNCEEGNIILKNNEVEYSFSQVKKWVIGMHEKVCKSKEQEHAQTKYKDALHISFARLHCRSTPFSA